jgi:5'-3' exonuclease
MVGHTRFGIQVAGPPVAAYAVRMIVHLVDGTYELFRHFYSPSPAANDDDAFKGVRGVVGSVFGMLEGGATHLGVATDHVIESFRNDLWPGYKTGEGVDPVLFAQFEPLEEALEAMGVVVWAMTEFEADDALAAAAAMAAADPRVTQVVICTPDKDLAQCVRGNRVVQLDRRANLLRDEAGVREKYGVPPESIPDWLALVGDSSDGYPGLPGWGPKSAATVLSAYGHLERIPERGMDWSVKVSGAMRLAATLAEQREQARLFRRLACLRTDAPVSSTVDALLWQGPGPSFAEWCARLGTPQLSERATRLAATRKAAHAG